MSKVIRSNDELNALANGKELIVNGTNLVDTRGWTSGNATLSVNAGKLRVTNTVGYGYADTIINTNIGSTYECSVDVTDITGDLMLIRAGTTAGSDNIFGGHATASGLFTFKFVAVGTQTHMSYYAGQITGMIAEFNNISVKEIPQVQGENLPDYVATRSNFGFKNYIINGGFDVWQRGTTIVSTNEYTADRFITITSSPAITVAKTANGTTVEKIATSGYAIFAQMIESNKYMSGKTVTLSIKLKSISGGGKVDVRINGAAAKNSINSIYVPTFSEGATFNLTNDFITYIVTATLPTYTDEDYTVAVVFDLRDAYTGSTTDKIEIAQVQLEEGSVATPFEQRPYGLELSLCQRYYEKVAVGLFTAYTGSNYDITYFNTEKRTNSYLVTLYNGFGQTVSGRDTPEVATNYLLTVCSTFPNGAHALLDAELY